MNTIAISICHLSRYNHFYQLQNINIYSIHIFYIFPAQLPQCGLIYSRYTTFCNITREYYTSSILCIKPKSGLKRQKATGLEMPTHCQLTRPNFCCCLWLVTYPSNDCYSRILSHIWICVEGQYIYIECNSIPELSISTFCKSANLWIFQLWVALQCAGLFSIDVDLLISSIGYTSHQ